MLSASVSGVDRGPDGVTLKASEDLTPEQAAVVAEVSETTTRYGGSIRFRLHSKTDALDKLCRYLQLFVEKIDINVNGEVAVKFTERVEQVRQELEAQRMAMTRIEADRNGHD